MRSVCDKITVRVGMTVCPSCGATNTMWPVWRRSSHRCEVCGATFRDRWLDKVTGWAEDHPRRSGKAGVLTVVPEPACAACGEPATTRGSDGVRRCDLHHAVFVNDVIVAARARGC